MMSHRFPGPKMLDLRITFGTTWVLFDPSWPTNIVENMYPILEIETSVEVHRGERPNERSLQIGSPVCAEHQYSEMVTNRIKNTLFCLLEHLTRIFILKHSPLRLWGWEHIECNPGEEWRLAAEAHGYECRNCANILCTPSWLDVIVAIIYFRWPLVDR